MVNKCCVPGCKSGYHSQKSKTLEQDDKKISFHKFPDPEKEPDHHQKWIKNIHRDTSN